MGADAAVRKSSLVDRIVREFSSLSGVWNRTRSSAAALGSQERDQDPQIWMESS